MKSNSSLSIDGEPAFLENLVCRLLDLFLESCLFLFDPLFLGRSCKVPELPLNHKVVDIRRVLDEFLIILGLDCRGPHRHLASGSGVLSKLFRVIRTDGRTLCTVGVGKTFDMGKLGEDFNG